MFALRRSVCCLGAQASALRTTSTLLRSSAAPAAPKTVLSLQQTKRTLTSFSNPLSSFRTQTRPTLPQSTTSSLSLATTLDAPGASANSGLGSGLLQSRGPKRDTFDPSHRVRKRRHGFLSRIRTRNGRALVKRRRLKLRSTLGH